jgi:hypothetical protein
MTGINCATRKNNTLLREGLKRINFQGKNSEVLWTYSENTHKRQ